jgi:hypothetical protein
MWREDYRREPNRSSGSCQGLFLTPKSMLLIEIIGKVAGRYRRTRLRDGALRAHAEDRISAPTHEGPRCPLFAGRAQLSQIFYTVNMGVARRRADIAVGMIGQSAGPEADGMWNQKHQTPSGGPQA